MKTFLEHAMFAATLLLVSMVPVGCGSKSRSADTVDLTISKELGPTVGSVARVAQPEPLMVEGYGLVGGLAGTGSAACPPEIRTYLKQYILSQTTTGSLSPDDLINSRTTAVVRLQGATPAASLSPEPLSENSLGK